MLRETMITHELSAINTHWNSGHTFWGVRNGKQYSSRPDYVLAPFGFGKLVKVEQKKRGWGPCKIDFVDGGQKLVILRLLGKEMGTPFLIGPAGTSAIRTLDLTPGVVSEGVPPVRAPAPVGSADRAATAALQKRAEVSWLAL